MAIALPQDTSWNAFDNNYNRSAYERICKEFYVDINADWRQKQSDNQGLGRIYNYMYTGLVLDTTHLIKESNTTKRSIHSHTPQPMIYST